MKLLIEQRKESRKPCQDSNVHGIVARVQKRSNRLDRSRIGDGRMDNGADEGGFGSKLCFVAILSRVHILVKMT